MDAFPDATDEELERFPNLLCTVHKWMLSNGKTDSTAKTYVRTLARLCEDDGKGPASMASQEYFAITKASQKNKSCNGQRSAAVKVFMDFWALHSGGALEDAAGNKIYQLKGRPAPARSGQPADSAAPKGEEAPQPPEEPGPPSEGVPSTCGHTDGEAPLAAGPGGVAPDAGRAAQRPPRWQNLQEAATPAEDPAAQPSAQPSAASSAAAPVASGSAVSEQQAALPARPPSAQPPGGAPDAQGEAGTPQSSRERPNREPSAGSSPQASQVAHFLPEDAPEDHIVHTRLKYCEKQTRYYFNFPAPDGSKVAFQTTDMASGSRENAAVIARACYMKFEEGLSKEEVTVFRKECYDRVKAAGASSASLGASSGASRGAPTAASLGASAGASRGEDDPHGHKKRRREDPDAKSPAKAARKRTRSGKAGRGDAQPSSAPAAAAKEANGKGGSSSSSSSGSSSSSSASDEEDVTYGERGAEAPSRKPLRPTGPLGRLGCVAAKLSVRTGLRCWCCYETACVRAQVAVSH